MAFLLKVENFNEFIKFLKKNFRLIAPTKKDNLIVFDEIAQAEEITQDHINTDFPLKKFFLPDGEILFKYKKLRKGIKLKEIKDEKTTVLFGVRPCDANALNLLDKVFSEDPYYQQKRKKTKVIVVNCTHAGPNCFCTSFSTSHVKEGFDLALTKITDGYYVKVGSKWGKEVVNSKFFEKTSKTYKREFADYKRFFVVHGLERKLDKIFESNFWEKQFEKCLACGACTMVCPTCYCFSLVHEPDVKEGVIKRVWDSCTLKDFSRVAGDFVFRAEKTKRLKQFIYHKFSYFKKRFGSYLCTGCGRCIEHCPAKIDFQKILAEVK